MLPVEVIPDHIARPEQKVGEGAFGILIQEGDTVKSAFRESVFAGHFLRAPPWDETQGLPNSESPVSGLERMLHQLRFQAWSQVYFFTL